MIEGGRTRNESTALKVKLGAVDLLKTATSSNSRIQNKEVESHAQHEGSAHCIYVHHGAYPPIRLISHKVFRSVRRVLEILHLILPWYYYGAIISNTYLRQDCPVHRADTPYRHSTLGQEKC